MTEQNPLTGAPSPLTWAGNVQLRTTRSAVQTGSEIQVRLTWAQPVEAADCLISLRDRHGAVAWSEKIAPGKSEVSIQLAQTVAAGTYTLEVSIENWILAQESIEVLEEDDLTSYGAFLEAISLREQASEATTWEDIARLDELAAEAYERSRAEHLAAICLLDVAEMALENNAPERARAAAVRAMKLAVRSDNMSVLASALLRLGQVEFKLDRQDSAFATLDRARTIAEVARIDLVAVRSSILQWRCGGRLDRVRRLQQYRNLMPKLAFAMSPAAQREAIECVKELKGYRILEYATPIDVRSPIRWRAYCDFESRHLAQYADMSRIADVVFAWDASAESFSNALLKRVVTSFAKCLIGFSLDVVLAVEANRTETGESFKVALRGLQSIARVNDATLAWSKSEDFTFLHELSNSAGGVIRTNSAAGSALVDASCPLVELTLPNNI